jgi:hypothetical protein
MFGEIPGTVAACAGLLLSALPAIALADRPACPAVWDGYVETVRKIVESFGGDADIVFVDREGKAFDCLGKGFSENELQRITLIESSLPVDREAPLGDRANTWPSNICSIGTGTGFLGPDFISVSLPLEPRILGLDPCRRSVSGGLERALGRIGD